MNPIFRSRLKSFALFFAFSLKPTVSISVFRSSKDFSQLLSFFLTFFPSNYIFITFSPFWQYILCALNLLTLNNIVPCSDCGNHLKVIGKISEHSDSCKSCINCGVRHTKGKCRLDIEYKSKIKEMYKFFFNSYGNEVQFTLKPCPYCLRLFPSIPPLSVIKCPGCSKLYCGNESCKMEPIFAHGEAYHRPRCKYYRYGEKIIPDKYHIECRKDARHGHDPNVIYKTEGL